jgi:hypothetical protein
LTTAPRIKPTSIFLRSARRPNPGRRSTYRRGIIVQTTGTGSICAGFNPITLAQTLIEMGALLPGVDTAGKTRAKRQFRIPGHRKARFYHISARFLQGD